MSGEATEEEGVEVGEDQHEHLGVALHLEGHLQEAGDDGAGVAVEHVALDVEGGVVEGADGLEDGGPLEETLDDLVECVGAVEGRGGVGVDVVDSVGKVKQLVLLAGHL